MSPCTELERTSASVTVIMQGATSCRGRHWKSAAILGGKRSYRGLTGMSEIQNPSKTQFVVFRSKSKPLDPGVQLQLGALNIAPSAHVRYLGVVIDQHLSFRENVVELERKVGCK
eukprot:scpid105723/ scgid15575/ 